MRECVAEEAVRYPIHPSSTLAAQLFLVRSDVLEESKAGVNVRSPRRRIKSTNRNNGMPALERIIVEA